MPTRKMRAKEPYKVSSGGQTVEVAEAEDAFDACVQAVKTEKFEALGLIFTIRRKDEDDCFCSTERVCKAAGMWRD